MTRTRVLITALLAAVACLAPAAPAVALIDLAQAAASDVAVESGAPLTADGRDRLETAARTLRSDGTPVKFVVLDARPSDPIDYARSLRRRLSFTGDVLVLSANPRNLSIGSPLPTSTVQGVYESQLPTLRSDPVAGTIAVANGLASRRGTAGAAEQGAAAPVADDGGSESGSGGAVLLVILLIGAAVVAVLVVVGRRKGRTRAAQTVAADASSLDPLVDGLAAQITDLDDDVQTAGELTAPARAHYDIAVLAYGEARELLEARPQNAQSVRAAGDALEKGLRAARRTRAVLEGRPVEEADTEPLLEGLCAFDPKHGKATTTALITTPSGETAELPACASCAAEVAAGSEPRFREVEDRGRQVPYWQGRGMGGMGGGGMGPVLGGALAGMILGGMFGGGAADASQGGFGDDSWGGGDSGGGGGGDLGGGGDFGGGGGGDFGGGGGGDF